MDGYGDTDNSTESCDTPPGFSENDGDCDDNNSDIYPGADEIVNNGVDEDCDGQDLVSGIDHLGERSLVMFPNPVEDYLHVGNSLGLDIQYEIYNVAGQSIDKGVLARKINLEHLRLGSYVIRLNLLTGERSSYTFIKKI